MFIRATKDNQQYYLNTALIESIQFSINDPFDLTETKEQDNHSASVILVNGNKYMVDIRSGDDYTALKETVRKSLISNGEKCWEKGSNKQQKLTQSF